MHTGKPIYILFIFWAKQTLLIRLLKISLRPIAILHVLYKKSGKVQAICKFLMSIVRVFNFKSMDDCPPYFFSFIGTNMIFWRIMITRFYLYVSISMKRRVSIKNMKLSALHTFFIYYHLFEMFFFVKIYWVFHGKKWLFSVIMNNNLGVC